MPPFSDTSGNSQARFHENKANFSLATPQTQIDEGSHGDEEMEKARYRKTTLTTSASPSPRFAALQETIHVEVSPRVAWLRPACAAQHAAGHKQQKAEPCLTHAALSSCARICSPP